MTCLCHDDGYEEGFEDGRRSTGMDAPLSELVYEWALMQVDDYSRAAGLFVAECLKTTSVEVESLAKAAHERKARTVRMYALAVAT